MHDGQRERIDLFNSLNIPDDRLAIFVHPTAYMAPNVELSPDVLSCQMFVSIHHQSLVNVVL